MKQEARDSGTAAILLAKGFDEKFVNHCVAELREAGIRTYLVGLTQLVRSWHGVQIRMDKLLRQISSTSNMKLLVIPGRSNCVTRLSLDPQVPEIVRHVLSQEGWVAVTQSAEATLERQKHEFPPNMQILPAGVCETRQLHQREQDDCTFIQSLIRHLQ